MNFIFQFGEFTSAETSLWKTIIPLVAPMVALGIYFLSQRRAEGKEKKSKINLENNKLRFLHYLVADSLRPINMFKAETNKIRANFYDNFFIIPGLDRIIPHSLNTISNKINHEEYYIASLNRIDEDISELFLVYNSLYDSIVESVAYYYTNRQLLIQSKSDYNDALDDLVESYISFTNQITNEGNNANEANILPYLNGLLGVVPIEENRRWNVNWMKASQVIFTNQLITILSQNQSIRSKALIKECKEINLKYNNFRSTVENVINALGEAVVIQDDMVNIITRVRIPLDQYINDLNEVEVGKQSKTTLDRLLGLFNLQKKTGI